LILGFFTGKKEDCALYFCRSSQAC